MTSVSAAHPMYIREGFSHSADTRIIINVSAARTGKYDALKNVSEGADTNFEWEDLPFIYGQCTFAAR